MADRTDLWWFIHMDAYFAWGEEAIKHLSPDEQEEVIKRFQQSKEARRG